MTKIANDNRLEATGNWWSDIFDSMFLVSTCDCSVSDDGIPLFQSFLVSTCNCCVGDDRIPLFQCFLVSICNSCVNDDGIPLLQCFLVSTCNCCVSDDGITFVSMFSGFGRNRMCKELVEIQRGDCSDLGDIMSICRDMNRVSMLGRYYGKCLKENNVDSFKVCTVFLA